MKNIFKPLVIAAFCIASTQLTACKGGDKDKTATDTLVTDTTAAAPVTVAPDEELTTNVKDATKDFPTVTATVANGEITLTGSLKREKLPQLMMSLNALHAKKINNNLTLND